MPARSEGPSAKVRHSVLHITSHLTVCNTLPHPTLLVLTSSLAIRNFHVGHVRHRLVKRSHLRSSMKTMPNMIPSRETFLMVFTMDKTAVGGRCLHICICIFICTYLSIYIYIYMCVYIHLYLCIRSMYEYIYVYLCLYLYLYLYIYIYKDVCVCVRAYVHIYIYMFIHSFNYSFLQYMYVYRYIYIYIHTHSMNLYIYTYTYTRIDKHKPTCTFAHTRAYLNSCVPATMRSMCLHAV